MKRAAISLLALLALESSALAQSNPGWATGFIPTAAQWAAAFSAHMDYPRTVLQTSAAVIAWDSNTTVANATIPVLLPPWTSGTVISCSYYTGGGTPSFVATLKIGATTVTGCAPTVTSSTPATSTATANNTFTPGSNITLVISAASGTPNTALFQINFQAADN